MYAWDMQKRFLLLTVVILVFLATSPASALTPKDLQASISAKREQIKETVQERRMMIKENIQEHKDAVQEKREAFKEKIKTIRDQKKQVVVERIANKLTTVNQNQTTRLTGVIEKLTNFITTIEEKVSKAKTDGQDTSLAETAVSNAKTAIDNARSAVATQVATDYTITINTENTLRNDVGVITNQFRSDMQATHKAVVDAKQAVMQAAREVAKLRETKPDPRLIQ